MTTPNPFAPELGAPPPVLVGREDALEDFETALAEGVGAPERVTLVTGPAGSGKTALLRAYRRAARDAGWLVIAETARVGLLERLVDSTIPALLRDAAREVSPEGPVAPVPDIRYRLGQLLDACGSAPGVLLSIDDLRRTRETELVAVAIQHLRRERRDIALVGAGSPAGIHSLLADEAPTSFLRRAARQHLEPITPAEARDALEGPIAASGRAIDRAALELAAESTNGLPLMLQLVGSEMWEASAGSDRIEIEHVRRGVERAQRRIDALALRER